MIHEFEMIYDKYHDPKILKYHDSFISNQLKFKRDVNSLSAGENNRNKLQDFLSRLNEIRTTLLRLEF